MKTCNRLLDWTMFSVLRCDREPDHNGYHRTEGWKRRTSTDEPDIETKEAAWR